MYDADMEMIEYQNNTYTYISMYINIYVHILIINRVRKTSRFHDAYTFYLYLLILKEINTKEQNF